MWWEVGCGFVGIALVGYTFQDYLLYYPTIENSRTQFLKPTGTLANVFEEHFLTTEDNVRLNLWLFRHSNPSRPTLLFFHGNAGNISHRLLNIRSLFEDLQCNVAILEYRGFGKSDGWPTQKGIEIDAKTALHWLKSDAGTPNSPIILYGRSLGGAVSIHLAASEQENLDGIIIENTFTCIADMMDVLMKYLTWAKFLLRNPWRSIDLISSIKKPLLFISSTNDELVPSFMMEALYSKAPESNKTILRYPLHHMDCWTAPTYTSDIKEWMTSQGFYKD